MEHMGERLSYSFTTGGDEALKTSSDEFGDVLAKTCPPQFVVSIISRNIASSAFYRNKGRDNNLL